jgi:regulator of protease activity HflC (stomatin/prohibitin superfamily)
MNKAPAALKAVLLASASLALVACTQVHAGHVGIRINQFGEGAGVDPNPLGVGIVWTPPGTDVVEYPIYTQTYTYTSSPTEGSQNDESFSFQDKNGLTLSANIAVSYSVNPGCAPKLYTKFRLNADQLVGGQIRNAIRDALANRASTLGIEDIYGPQHEVLMSQVQTDVHNYFAPFCLDIEKLFWAGPLKMPDQVLAQINQRVANEQAAQAAQANVATATANANAVRETAKGQADANGLIADSIAKNPNIIQFNAVAKWDGHLPEYMLGGNTVPFITLPQKQQ